MYWKSALAVTCMLLVLAPTYGQWHQPPVTADQVWSGFAPDGSPTYPDPGMGYVQPVPPVPNADWGSVAQPLQSEWYTAFRTPVAGMGVQMGVLGLVRERPASQVIAVDENNATLLNANELQGSMQFGFEAIVDFNNVSPLLGGTGIEFGYFGINSLDALRVISADEVSAIFFNSYPVEPPSTSTFLYSTNLYSGEANLRFRCRSRIRPITGLRFLKIEDQYDVYDFVSGQQIGGFSKTNNHMFGGQFGAEADVYRFGQTRVYANGKYGAMCNQVDGSTRAANATGDAVEKYFGDKHYSSLVDAGVGVDYGLAGPLSLRVGYRFLMASSVANGLEQNRNIRLLSPGETVTFGSQQWHGLDCTAILSF